MENLLSPEQFHIKHLLGTTEEKRALYSDHRCPEAVLRAAAESINGPDDLWILSSLAANYSTTTEMLEDLKKRIDANTLPQSFSAKLRENINHPVYRSWLWTELLAASNLQVRLSQICGADDNLCAKVHDDIFIAGGCIPSIITLSEVNDVDVWFKSSAPAVAFCRHVFQMLGMAKCELKVESNGITILSGVRKNENIPWNDSTVYITDNAITFTDNMKRAKPIQFILCRFGNPDEVVANFDFIHCMCSADLRTLSISLPPDSYFAAKRKMLIYTGKGNPLGSLHRFAKLTGKRNHYCAPEELQKLVAKIQAMNLGDPKELIGKLVDYYGQPLSDRIDLALLSNIRGSQNLADGSDPSGQ
jgi:hypothetical protein